MKDLIKVILFFSTPFIACYLVSFLERITANVPMELVTIIIFTIVGLVIRKIFKYEERLKNDKRRRVR